MASLIQIIQNFLVFLVGLFRKLFLGGGEVKKEKDDSAPLKKSTEDHEQIQNDIIDADSTNLHLRKRKNIISKPESKSDSNSTAADCDPVPDSNLPSLQSELLTLKTTIHQEKIDQKNSEQKLLPIEESTDEPFICENPSDTGLVDSQSSESEIEVQIDDDAEQKSSKSRPSSPTPVLEEQKKLDLGLELETDEDDPEVSALAESISE